MVRRIPNMVRLLIFSLMLIVLGALGLCKYAPQAYPLFFSDIKRYSVPALLKVGRTVEAEVTGVFDFRRILEERTMGKNSEETRHKDYYYAFMDKAGDKGFYVYSDLLPKDFIKTYGTGSVTLQGIWEKIPKEVQLQEPMHRFGELTGHISGQGPVQGVDDLVGAIKDFEKAEGSSVSTWNRLNLGIRGYKAEKAGLLLLLSGMFTGGIFFLIYLVRSWKNAEASIQ